MKVCHIIHNLQVGGTERALEKTLRALQPNGFEFSVISLLGNGEIGRRIQDLGIPVIELGLRNHHFSIPSGLRRLFHILRNQKPDVVQTWAYHSDLIGGFTARIAYSAPVVWNVRHGSLDAKIDSMNTIRSARLCGKLSHHVPSRIVVNCESAKEVHAQVGYDREKMLWIPNGFDVNEWKRSPQSRDRLRAAWNLTEGCLAVGMCGRFHRHKGQQQFVEAATQLANRMPNSHFFIIGEGCDEQNPLLVDWITKAALGNRVHLLGRRDDIPALMSALDVFVLPSITEGMPNVVGEAMACETPCVVTDVGDTRKLLSNDSWVVAPDNATALAHAIERIAALSETKRAQLGQELRRRIEQHFSLQKVAEQYATLWHDVAQHRIAAPTRARTAEHRRPKLMHVMTVPMTPYLFLRGQNQFMHDQGFDVHLACSAGNFLELLRLRDPVTTHAIHISRKIAPIQDMLALWRLWRLFRKLRPDIVQVSTPKAALLGSFGAWMSGVPIRIYQIRGLSSESETGVRRRIYQMLERLTARLCNHVFVNAETLLTYSRQVGILRPQDGMVVGQGMSNGVDITRFDPDQICPADLDANRRSPVAAGPVIGYVGRLTRDKGVEDLFDAWKIIRDRFSNARLLLVGPWEKECAVSADYRAAIALDPRVVVAGAQRDVAPWLRAMSLFVFPSHGTEGFPNAPMEAAAMRLPIVATRVVGSIDAVQDGITGTIVPPRDPGALAAAIAGYLDDEALAQKHAAAAYARVRDEFRPEHLWHGFLDQYHLLLTRHGLPLPEPHATDSPRVPDVPAASDLPAAPGSRAA